MAATDTTRQDDLSVAELVRQFSAQTSHLIRGETKHASPTPERTVENVKRDVEELKEGRRR